MIPTYEESDLYYFDEEAADRPVRFIEKYCKHPRSGKPFVLLDWQRTLVRTLFGFKRRADGRRRFKKLYVLAAKGCGKTPLLGAIGLYMLLGDREPHPYVISMAAEAKQARHTFNAARGFIEDCPALQAFATPQKDRIKGHKKDGKSNGEWVTLSGKPKGASGSIPNCVMGDEVQEWSDTTAEGFELVTKNLFKRPNSLLMTAANAGKSMGSYAYQQHCLALKTLSGEIKNDDLLPVIFEAPLDLPYDSEEAAKAANPSMGEIITFEDLQGELAKSRLGPAQESEYRRLYLSQWPTTVEGEGLDMALWDAATKPFGPEELKDAVLYDAIDLSLNNDLSAVVYIWATPDRFYIDADFWLPRPRAEEHQEKHGIHYLDWAKPTAERPQGFISLVDGPTISPAVRLQIAARITERSAGHKLKAVCYDPHRAAETVAALEATGTTCVSVRQGWSVTPGCEELQRRLQDKSITISPNPVLRFCAVNTRFTPKDRQGNYWPVKPQANLKTNNVGTRYLKIDGISALVTGLTEARKHTFPNVRKMHTMMPVLISSAPTPVVQRPMPQLHRPAPRLR